MMKISQLMSGVVKVDKDEFKGESMKTMCTNLDIQKNDLKTTLLTVFNVPENVFEDFWKSNESLTYLLRYMGIDPLIAIQYLRYGWLDPFMVESLRSSENLPYSEMRNRHSQIEEERFQSILTHVFGLTPTQVLKMELENLSLKNALNNAP